MSSRVLLVEDNPDDEALTLRALKKSKVPLSVVVARDGVEALDALGIHGQGGGCALPDLVLLDIKVPKISGLEVLRVIRQTPVTEQLPVVMLTSSDEPSDVISATRLRVSHYIRKPVDYDEFMQQIAAVLEELLKEPQ
jgi:two-component system response regulator